MQKIYTTADYEVKQGRFLVVFNFNGDRCTEVSSDIAQESDEARNIALSLQGSQSGSDYWIHDGFVIVNSTDPHSCVQILPVKNREEAEKSLIEFIADLNSYPDL